MLFRGQVLGKYRIEAPLGSGGFAAVYRARDTWIDKDVAIKVPHKQNLNFNELLREPRLLAALDHPNIVSIATADKQDQIFFIVMEYVDGTTLDDTIAEQGTLPVETALDYTRQIGLALAHAHQQGVIHRDLRPTNVLISATGVLKVADFGTSRFLELAGHGTTVIGSPPYMAPEQFDGKAVFASDLYSLGVTMYQMLTGVLPYDPPTPADFARLRAGELARPPRELNLAIPAAVNDVVMTAMAPQLAERYRSAADLIRALDACLIAAPEAGAEHRTAGERPAATVDPPDEMRPIQNRLHARDPQAGAFCWKCRKPLPVRTDRCPFCSEIQ